MIVISKTCQIDAELEEKELEDTAIGGGGGGKHQEYNSCVNTADGHSC